MYHLIRSFLFLFDPEKVHYFSMHSLRILCRLPLGKRLLSSIYKPKGNHEYKLFNIQFSNRVGLGAGFDKNAAYLNELEALGFGFVEIGTITPLPQDGNSKPRLFRLPKDKAIINRMGFNNDGMDVVAERLKKWKSRRQATDDKRLIIGGNIGKNKITPNEDAWLDYEKCFLALHAYVDCFVVNVSSPNTPGLRELQDKDSLRRILTNLQMLNTKLPNPKPILLKIAPDLTLTQIDDVIDLSIEIKLDGLVATNTTISREGLSNEYEKISKETGGLSGQPLKQMSTNVISYIHQKTNGQLPVIGSGGIITAADAKEKIDAGASLIQVWTGFIYTGPGIVKNICKNL